MNLANVARAGVLGLFVGLASLSYLNKKDAEPEAQPSSTIEQHVEDVVSPEVLPWKQYELSGFESYNSLLPVMHEESERTGVPLETLAVIALNESRGEGGVRHEPAFQRRYVEKQFDEPTTFSRLYEKLNAQNPDLTLETFKEQLASSVGPFQIMYLVAVERGFRGSFDELARPDVNAHFAAEHLKRKGVDSSTPLETALKIYNTGSAKGTPYKGYLDRAKSYCDKLGVRYE